MKAIKMRNVSYTYPDGKQALHDINIYIKKHKKTVLLGSNGSGKTTLLMHANGLILPQTGEVLINEQTITEKNVRQLRLNVGFLFDIPDHQLFATTVLQDVAFGPWNKWKDKQIARQKALKAMEEVGILHLQDISPQRLSLGEKKKAAIAGIIAMEPEILICDEPFSGLDPKTSQTFLQLLDRLHSQGTTLILSTHDVDFAYAWADDIIILKEGTVFATGHADLLEDEEQMEEAQLSCPTLARLFSSTPYRPRTIDQATRKIIKLFSNI